MWLGNIALPIERETPKLTYFWSIPLSSQNLSLHRKWKNERNKNNQTFKIVLGKIDCSWKCKILILLVVLDFDVFGFFFSNFDLTSSMLLFLSFKVSKPLQIFPQKKVFCHMMWPSLYLLQEWLGLDLVWIFQFFTLDVQNSMFLLSVVPIYILAQNLAILWKKMTAILHDPSEGLCGPDLWKKRLWIFFFNGVKIFQSD